MDTIERKLNINHSLFGKSMMLYYRGVFNYLILSGIGAYIKEVLRLHPQISYKVFSVFVELAQNICYHSESQFSELHQEAVKLGTVSIEENAERYKISTGNIIKNEDIEFLNKCCQNINNLDNRGLRDLKKQYRKVSRRPSGHASIGLIQVAIASANPIAVETKTIDDELSFIILSTNITKTL